MDESGKTNDAWGWFWRILGSTVIGSGVLTLITLFNYLGNNIHSIRTETLQSVSEVRLELQRIHKDDIADLKEAVAAIDQHNESVKAEILDIREDLKSLREHFSLNDQGQAGLKERLSGVEQQLSTLQVNDKDLQKEIQLIREKIISLTERN